MSDPADLQPTDDLLFVPSTVANRASSSLLAIHMLAQASDVVSASIPLSPVAHTCLGLAGAYGVEHGVTIRSDTTSDAVPPGAILVDSSVSTPASLWFQLTRDSNVARPAPAVVPQGSRVAIVVNLPVHYRVALFNEIAECLAARGSSLHVLFTASKASDRSWLSSGEIRFEHRFVSALGLDRGKGRRSVVRGIGADLDAIDPTVVICGGFSPFVSGRVSRWCHGRGRPFGIWSGEIASRPTARSQLRAVQRRRLLRSADFAVAYGWDSARYLDAFSLGLPVVIGRNTTIMPPSHRSASRFPVRLLAVARAERGKRLDLIVAAVRRLDLREVTLTIVGDGPELSTLRTSAADADNISFIGAVSPEDALRIYGTADVFLFPSTYDIFGLVLVEAMGAGLPVITSEAPGAVSDLVLDAVNGLIVREPSVAAWEAAIRRLVVDDDLRRRLGQAAAQSTRSRWTIEHAAAAMIAACKLGTSGRAPGFA